MWRKKKCVEGTPWGGAWEKGVKIENDYGSPRPGGVGVKSFPASGGAHSVLLSKSCTAIGVTAESARGFCVSLTRPTTTSPSRAQRLIACSKPWTPSL